MAFDPHLAVVRYGTGLSLRRPLPADADALLAELTGPDEMAMRFPIPGFADATPSHAALVWVYRAARNAQNGVMAEAANEARSLLRKQVIPARQAMHLSALGRAIDADFGLRERMTAFFADHFTVEHRSADTFHLVQPYIEDAIRPHVGGRFPEMVCAVATHPMMLLYLDQARSIGPASEVALQTGAGLNENLARELLELHLLGVGGGYAQADVRELAELLTGLTYQPGRGFHYDPRRAEPGGEEVLGLRFAEAADLDTVKAALTELALHPQTAAHLAQKIAAHFLSPAPPEDVVAAMTAAFLDTGGSIPAVMAALFDHPAAWAPERQKVRLPQEFIVAGLRALRVNGRHFAQIDDNVYRDLVQRPLRIMGQPLFDPAGPDGWSEDPADWIIPQAMAGRITWAFQAPVRLVDQLPDPRDFVRHALGPDAPRDVAFAAAAAEKPQDGIGVVLASAAFQRR